MSLIIKYQSLNVEKPVEKVFLPKDVIQEQEGDLLIFSIGREGSPKQCILTVHKTLFISALNEDLVQRFSLTH